MLSNRHVVILKDPEGDRYLPIWIGAWEASAIAMRLQGLAAERPLTHDLFAAALGATTATGGVAFFAHIGGFVLGVAVGLLLRVVGAGTVRGRPWSVPMG